jgi:hypothetical protein
MFNNSLPFTKSKKYKITLAILSGIFVFVFLLFFQPFGINNYRPDEKISPILALAVFALAVIIILIFLTCEFILRPLVLKTNTIIPFVGWLIFEILIVSSCTFLLYNTLGGFHDFYVSSYLKHIVEIGFVLAFPIVATLFYFKHTTILREYMEVQSLSKTSDTMQEIVLLSGDYKNDRIALPIKSIVYIESEDNYASLNYIEGETVRKYLIRSTLTSLEEKLKPEFFLRCNRSVIVNLIHFESYKYHHNKLLLKLKFVPEPISVSKSHQSKILSFLEKQSI